MRIGILMSLAPRKNGSFEDWLLALCREARWRGHQVAVYGYRPVLPSIEDTLRELEVPYRELEGLSRLSIQEGARLLACSHDVLHLNMIQPRSRIALMAYAALSTRVLYVAHSHALPGSRNGPLTRLRRWLFDRACGLRIQSVAGVSRFAAEVEGGRFGLSPRRIHTIHNGIDTRKYGKPRPDRPEGAPIELIAVAHLIRHKGVHRLLEAFAELEGGPMRLTIVGDGPDEQWLRERAETLQLGERVRFLGLRHDVPELLDASDVFVHTSEVEAFGYTIAEAMATGLAVIASDVGGVPELIVNGEHGLLVPPKDVAALREALRKVAESPELRAHLSERSRQRIKERFSLQDSVAGHLDWCELYARKGARNQLSESVPGGNGVVVVPALPAGELPSARPRAIHPATNEAPLAELREEGPKEI